MPRLLSGRVGVTSYAGLSTERQQTPGFPSFLGIEEAEPNLGLPSDNNYVLYGTVTGERYWAEPSGSPSGTASGLTVSDEGITPTGYAGSVTRFNFVGNGINVEQTKQTFGGVEVGVATVFVEKSTLSIADADEFVRATGITTIKVGAGLSFYPEPGRAGVVTIFSAADARSTMQNADGTEAFGNVSTFRIGAGLTVSQVTVGIASIGVTGQFEHVNATGIVTAGVQFKGNLAGTAVTATNFYGDLEGDVDGNLTGDVTGDVNAGFVTATKSVDGNINSSGVSTISQLMGTTLMITGIVTTNSGFVAPAGSFGFDGNLNAPGVSTATYLNSTNLLISGISTFNGNVEVSGTNKLIFGSDDLEIYHDGNDNILDAGNSENVYLKGRSVFIQANGTESSASFVQNGGVELYHNSLKKFETTLDGIDVDGTATANEFIGPLTGNVAGTINAPGISTVTNLLEIRSDDSTPGRIDYYCEVSNAHYTRVQAAPHSEYSGNVTAILPVKDGDIIVGDTAGAITQNLHTSGIVTATEFHGDGSNLTNLPSAVSVLVPTNTTDAEHFFTFVDTATGSEALRTDVDLKYNPGTNVLTAGTFNGNATGLTGDPSISVSGITLKGNMLPDNNGTRDLGAEGSRWANVYTSDMHFSNVGSGGNDVDGTEGNWTLQEGDENIYMINNITGKKYKIALTEV